MDRDIFDKDPSLRNIFDNMRDAVYFIDNNGRFLFINKAAEKLDGVSLRDLKGKTVMETYELTASESPLLRVVCSQTPLKEHFFRYYINNKDVYQICNTFPIPLEDGFWGAFSIQRDVTALKKTVDSNIELQKRLFEADSGKEKNEHLCNFNQIIGNHPSINDCKKLAFQAAQTDSSVMLTGLTGTGKELFAQSIHQAGPRRKRPFLAVNCAAIPETLLEGILFGTTKGVYTGAVDRKGLFEEAKGGTVFLDEINSMPVSSQSKLLRVLEEKKVQPLGSKEWIPVDVRIICGCNQYPEELLRGGGMRSDLFYRLAVVNILIPPLNRRKSDILVLADYFISRYNEKYQNDVLGIDDSVKLFFTEYDWPGNVRQLRHCVECAMNLMEPGENVIKRKHLPFYLQEGLETDSLSEYHNDKRYPLFQQQPSGDGNASVREVPEPVIKEVLSVKEQIKQSQRKEIVDVLIRCGGNVSRAARELKLPRQTLVYRMKKFDIN